MDSGLTPYAAEVAHRIGRRGGQRFLRSGIWPRCPFRGEHPTVRALALEWGHGAFGVLAEEIAQRRAGGLPA